ncbi:hypothetical protein Q3C01_25135 [Bradyrhizobium sp. UFLA05-109]
MKVEIGAGRRLGELRYNGLGEQIRLELFCRLDGRRDIHLQVPFRLEDVGILFAVAVALSRSALAGLAP